MPSKKTTKKKVITYVNYVLDESGSMYSIYDGTLEGFNTYRDTLREDSENEYLMSLTSFSFKAKSVFRGTSIHLVPSLSKENYAPSGGTALYDAIGLSIESTEKILKEMESSNVEIRVITVILTDGMENSSTRFTKEDIRKKIDTKEETGWQFVYAGADQNSWEVGQALGFDENACSAYRELCECSCGCCLIPRLLLL